MRIVLEEGIGDVVCVCAIARAARSPRISTCQDGRRLEALPPPTPEIARGLGLRPQDIGFDRHEPSLFTAGAPYLFVPVRSIEAIGRARPIDMRWNADGGPATFLYTSEVVEAGSAYHARMFADGCGVTEDPATGSAAAAFAGVTVAFDRPSDGGLVLTIEQGFEMGRPSCIALGLEIEGGELRSASIGGSSAVIVSSGALEL